MKITRVDALLMSCPLPEPLRLPFHGGERTILKRDAMLIRIATDTGLCGYAPGPAHERAATHIREHIAPFLEGRDPRTWREIRFTGSPEIQKTYHASEIALLDLAARFEGCPLSEIAGGRQRSRIKLYGSAGMYMAPDAYAEEAAAIQAQGFLAYKMRPALGPDGDLEALAHMRAATGPTFGLMIDAHSWWRMGDRSYTRDMVAGLAREMEAHRPAWLEEPLPPDDHDAYRWLKQHTRLPIATGEHERATQGLLDVIETGAADIIQMDVCCQGGLPTFQAVSRTAEAHGRRVAFHSWGTMLEVLVAAHLGVCWPEQVVEWLEHPCYASAGRAGMYPFGAADEILSEPLAIENGYLSVPDRPGLGIDVDETVVDRYPFIPGPWSIFRIDSPRSTVAVVGDHSVKWVEAERA
ncbi:MAG: mandelate racemase/muconate lactonizing enzyme family protein [Vicinamibacteraceae bacterium]